MATVTIARVVFWGAMVAWGALEVRHSRVFRAGDRSEDRGTFAWSLGAVLAGLASALLIDLIVPAVVPQEAQTPFLAAGAALVVAGVLFRLWAITVLGRFFTYQVTIAVDHQVVTDGPYRWLSHPSYTGLLLSCLGAGVASANLGSLVAVLLIPTYGLVRRIRVEEAALVEALGEPYERFRSTRKRLFPWIW